MVESFKRKKKLLLKVGPFNIKYKALIEFAFNFLFRSPMRRSTKFFIFVSLSFFVVVEWRDLLEN